MKYDVKLAITASDLSCSMHQYKVVHTLDNRYIMLDKADLSDACPATDATKKK
jgi:hypothetical protein